MWPKGGEKRFGQKNGSGMKKYSQLVVSTHLKNISEIGSFPQVGMKIKNIWKHHLDSVYLPVFKGPWNLTGLDEQGQGFSMTTSRNIC